MIISFIAIFCLIVVVRESNTYLFIMIVDSFVTRLMNFLLSNLLFVFIFIIIVLLTC
jgi:hypothetical protein